MNRKILVITDLDASLLQEDYSYEEAKPIIEKLKKLGFPIVLNSSKTLSELEAIAHEMGSTAPIIAENGGAVCIHCESSLTPPPGAIKKRNYFITNAGLSRSNVLEKVHTLRSSQQYNFQGFADWTEKELAEQTNLDYASAIQAKDRHVTEPILWYDTAERLKTFLAELSEDNIIALRGGKFIHLMGKIDKADGAKIVTELYKDQEPDVEWTVVALGDSENDLNMLEQADIPVVIPHKGDIRIRPKNPNTNYAIHEATQGWADTLDKILTRF